ncbi:hypothetical protein NDU88_000445 [Pleurodeles waltl]|uniref:Uncharacterized protein n=1 Tax=Pleurodeles waltl TaxID=8319 RepID=A0AAV7S7Q8_PLEWA|nr:hypothetical protein NDU88_000445 [Pleurodeles waltl]
MGLPARTMAENVGQGPKNGSWRVQRPESRTSDPTAVRKGDAAVFRSVTDQASIPDTINKGLPKLSWSLRVSLQLRSVTPVESEYSHATTTRQHNILT